MEEIKADDLDILADIAYQQEQAMREEMEFAGLVTSFMMTEEITSAAAEKKAHALMDAERDVAKRFTSFMQTTTDS